MNGLQRYIEVQRAVSSYRDERGLKLKPGRLRKFASQIYQESKNAGSVNQVVNNIDVWFDNITPQLPEEISSFKPFYEFDKKNHESSVSIIAPENLYIKSPQIQGPEWVIPASILSYEDHFKSFSDYCNANRYVFWDNSTDAPVFRISEIKFDYDEDKYIALLELGQDDGYGYEPGMIAEKNENQPWSQERTEPELEETPIKGKKAEQEKDSEVQMIKAETEKIKIETEKIKASESRIKAVNKAVTNLRKDLKDKLITKKQYSKMLEKLYEM